MNRKSLTTKNIAEYCQVTQRTVVQWISEEKLNFFRTPGKHIRVECKDFLDFLHRYKMPISTEFAAATEAPDQAKVLIVDDDKEMVSAIRRVLIRDKRFLIETAQDGFEAGRKFSEFKPQLIILDIKMPGFDGYQVCSHIRKNSVNNHVKILAMSGLSPQAQDVRKILHLGANEYLPKPFTNEELRSSIHRLLGQSLGASHA